MTDSLAFKLFFYLVVFLAGIIIWPFKISFLFGIFLAYISEDYLKYAIDKVPLFQRHKLLTSALFMVLVLAIILIPLGFLAYSAIVQLADLVSQIDISFAQRLTGSNWLSDKLHTYGITISGSEILERVNGALLGSTQAIVKYAGAVLTQIPNLTIELLLTFISWYFFLLDGAKLRAIFFEQLIPYEKIRTILLVNTKNVIKGLVVSSVLVSLIQSIIAIIVFGFSGIPHFLGLGFLIFFSSFIPMIGTLPVFIGVAIYCFANSLIVSGVVVCVGAVIVGTIDNVLRPLLMQTSLALNFFWLLLSIMGGIAQFGIAGTIVGPLIFSLGLSLFHMRSEV